MFTGIIQGLGHVESLSRRGEAMRMRIAVQGLDLGDVSLGDSIAVSGPCMTVVSLAPASFAVDVSPESLARTTLGSLAVGATVNLEKALRLADRLGGHLVSGHCDGIGEVIAREDLGSCVRFTLNAPAALARYIAMKGSIGVDGVSLTVNAIKGATFDLLIIPHTLERTTLGSLARGSRVNLEIDLLARYLERLLAADATPDAGLTLDRLRETGFLAS